ncbi:DUF4274 domain-containing protein [Celeribacter arenosi]|uniref:DUF4274 domain-containing protein n=1 Tax=Celeribacter arenosi TaxID=792649 RepID=A0ABP7JVY2_9RHOB
MDIGRQFQLWETEGKLDIPHDQIQSWLKEQNPDTWHKIAMSWHYDYDPSPLLWIVNQPDCDFGTACQIFGTEGHSFMTTPTWQELGDSAHQASWKMCNTIVERWQANSFATADLKPATGAMRTYQIMAPRHKDAGTPLTWDVPDHVFHYEGTRDAQSQYTSFEGQIYWNFDFWQKLAGFT